MIICIYCRIEMDVHEKRFREAWATAYVCPACAFNFLMIEILN